MAREGFRRTHVGLAVETPPTPTDLDRDLLDALGDEVSRDILAAAVAHPRSASELAAELDVSRSTVYRRLTDLVDVGLLVQAARADRGGRAGTAVYHTATDRLQVLVTPDGLGVHGLPDDEAAPAPVVESLDAEPVEGTDAADGPLVEVRFRVPAQRLNTLFSEVAPDQVQSTEGDADTDPGDGSGSGDGESGRGDTDGETTD